MSCHKEGNKWVTQICTDVVGKAKAENQLKLGKDAKNKKRLLVIIMSKEKTIICK